jgi:regulator of protease activity HflC (stomatin/prohibitin superfamily)
VPKQHAITKDNVQVGVDGTIFIKVTNVKGSCYNVDQPLNSILNLAQVPEPRCVCVAIAALPLLHETRAFVHLCCRQSIMRKEVGSMALDELMHNRASLNAAICTGMAGLEESWGIKVTRYEVQNIEVDKSTEESMAKQSAAERNRRVR